MEWTRHHSDAVCAYKCMSEHLLEAAAKATISDKSVKQKRSMCTVSQPESDDKMSPTMHVKLSREGGCCVVNRDDISSGLLDFLHRVDERSNIKRVKFEVQFCD